MSNARKFVAKYRGSVRVVMLSLILGVVVAGVFTQIATRRALGDPAISSEKRAALHELQDAFTSIVDEVSPSVVTITSKISEPAGNDNGGDNPFKGFPYGFPFPMPQMPDMPNTPQPKMEAKGSGVIVRSDGYILTNDHLVGGADTVTVTLKDGEEFQGKVLEDPRSDLAVVKIDAKDLTPATLGDSSKVKVGSWAIAIGSPFGLEETVTIGVISAVGRQEEVEDKKFYPSLLQTDASINPGNSGGPLANIDGEVIGINTLIRASAGGGNIGIGFAIPINTAKFVMDQLIARGKVTRGYIGIVPASLSPSDTAHYGVKEGSLVARVEPGSPAEKAGIQVEDVIISLDGKPVSKALDLRDIVASIRPGQEIQVVLVRNKQQRTLTARIGEFQASAVAQEQPETLSKMGVAVADLSPELLSQHQLDPDTKGIIITAVAPNSSASDAGIEAGMVITYVNGVPVTSVSDFNAATKDLKSGDTVRLRVKTKDFTALVTFPIE